MHAVHIPTPEGLVMVQIQCVYAQKTRDVWNLYEELRRAHDAHINNEPCPVCDPKEQAG
jgi:hypothetical protein